ncbi:helix-turn-helix transcriptional regulator [Dyadobacter sp. NIV53]|uniref:helix-turn-helix domain-containing protein n=1 Tax=Dyadobacter sp. NIV53 TaxID=2861765 RepID=UPI001C887E9B|nr:helix-turn-helix transcriptional regulator [Dyadobacter sp. NIV53]
MEISIYEARAKQIIIEIKQLIEAKGMSLDSSDTQGAIISRQMADEIFSGKTMPSLEQFLALCEISGITISMPAVETPDNPM